MRFYPDGETVKVEIRAEETCQCESDAVVTASGNTGIDGKMSGGLLASMARKMLTGETFFLQTLTSIDGARATAVLAPKCPGNVVVIDDLPRAGLVLVQGAFLAAASTITVESQMQHNMFNSAFSGTGFFTLHLSGQGPVAFGGFGRVFTQTISSEETVMVDNGHLVGWTADASFTMELASSRSVMSSFTSGEGLMCKFRGPGTVYVQSRNPEGYQEWLQGQLKGQQKGVQIDKGAPCCICVLFFVIVVVCIIAMIAIAANVNSDPKSDFKLGNQRHR